MQLFLKNIAGGGSLLKYLHFRHELSQDEREEVTRHCGFCTAKLYLEGKLALNAPAAAPPANSPVPSGGPPLKKRCTVRECVEKLRDLNELLDCGLLTSAEFTCLKEKLLKGE